MNRLYVTYSSKLNMDGEAIKSAFEGVHEKYKEILVKREINKSLFKVCISALNEKVNGDVSKITPSPANIFNAFRQTPWKNLRVIIIGQDPYPTEGDANGLCFSVNKNIAVPASLRNIHKALIKSGFITEAPNHGDLSAWAKQGVLMLNASLTTTVGSSGGHLDIWETYTDRILYDLAIECAKACKPIVFILWGGFAQKKQAIVNNVNYESIKNKWGVTHRVLTWGHPSPVSPFNKQETNEKHFIHCDNFAVCNNALDEYKLDQIDWDPNCLDE